MTADSKSHSELGSDPESHHAPDISVCESRPGKSVFLESGNTDGWIAIDLTADVNQ